jgi:acyl-CoA hydrolase
MLDEEPNTESHIVSWKDIRERWPAKFRDQERFIFKEIRPGDRIFVGTGCGEPQYLVSSLLNFVKSQPKAFLDAELINIVTLGVAPYTDESSARPDPIGEDTS